MTRKASSLIGIVLIVLLTGCAAGYGHWPKLDVSRARWVVAIGYFESSHELNERPCMMTDEEIESGVVDCWSGTPVQGRFVVDEVLFGKLRAHRLDIAAGKLPVGKRNPQILLFSTDGRHAIAQSWTSVVRQSGHWIIPVSADSYNPNLLPCDANGFNWIALEDARLILAKQSETAEYWGQMDDDGRPCDAPRSSRL